MRIRNLVVILAVAIIAALVALGGCKKKEEPAAQAKEVKKTATATAEEVKKTAETAAASVEQTMCPIMDGNKIDKNVFVEYKGKKVYFCCAGCKAKFDADPEKYVAKLPQFQQ
jgi:YHS domain-containing protein